MTMAFSATVSSLGGLWALPLNSPYWSFPIRIEGCSRIGFAGHGVGKGRSRAPGRACRCMSSTIIEKEGVPIAYKCSFIGANKNEDEDADSGLVFNPTSKPILKVLPDGVAGLRNRRIWTLNGVIIKEKPRTSVEDSEGLIGSLGEVLENGEKIEVLSTSEVVGREAHVRDNGRVNGNERNGKSTNLGSSIEQSRASDVQRKGGPISNVQNLVKEILQVEKKDREGLIGSLGEVLEKAEKTEVLNIIEVGRKVIHVRNNGKVNGNKRISKATNLGSSIKQSRARGVWRKGDPITNMQNMVREVPHVEEEDSERLNESLGEVLEKVEKFDVLNTCEVGSKVIHVRDNGQVNENEITGKSTNFGSSIKQSRARGVWRKGDPITSVQNTVREVPQAEKEDSERLKGSLGEVLEKVEKFEALNTCEVGNKVIHVRDDGQVNGNKSRGKATNFGSSVKQSRARGVWRNGDPITSVQNTVREVPHAEKEDSERLIGSLGEVLEKTEKFDVLNTCEVGSKDIHVHDNGQVNGNERTGKATDLGSSIKQSIARGVWRKGDAITSVQNTVREVPQVEKEDSERLIGPLGEVLEKAEKFDVLNTCEVGSKVIHVRDNGQVNGNKRTGKATNLGPSIMESRARDVWRKGDPITNVQNTVKVVPQAEKEDGKRLIGSLGEVFEKAEKFDALNACEVGSKDIHVRDNGQVNGNERTGKATNLDSSIKQSIARDVWRKGDPITNLKNAVKEVPQHSPAELASLPPSNLSVVPPAVRKQPILRVRKPILIDRFASKKKTAVNPIKVEVDLNSSVKPQGPPSSKAEGGRWRKPNASGALRRQSVEDEDDEIVEDDASELNVPSPGVTKSKKGRKWFKARHESGRLQAAIDSAPVRVDILEVGEEGMLTEDLAYKLAISRADIFGFLFSKGIKPETARALDKNMVKLICKQFEMEVVEARSFKVEEMARKKIVLDDEDQDMLQNRPPVITIMGHVDHGKTTLLDFIRKSKVVASEAGGITQGIGAYEVLVQFDGKPRPCVFLDTPGHEAFAAMRARGARVTDIAVIVVAADDGVRPQTIEAIDHAKAAGVPIIIAINKIDKDGANPERVMGEIFGVVNPEEWVHGVPMVQISAFKGENVDELLETIMFVAEFEDLKANPHRNAKGTIIEAGLDKAKGPVASLIVQNGTLRTGDIVVCGEAFGKVRALLNDKEVRVNEAGPSMAVQVVGLSVVPIAGNEFEVVSSLDVARERAEACAESLRVSRINEKAGKVKITLSSIASAVSEGKQSGLDLHQLNIILKVDVQGSIEAIRQAVQVLPQDNVFLKFVLQAPGDVSMSNVDLAIAANATIFGFNVKALGSIKKYAHNKNVEIRLYKVIYDLIDDLRTSMEGLLDLLEEQISIGEAKVQATFSSGSSCVAGCMVTKGKVAVNCGIRVFRKGRIIHTGVIKSLKRVKEDMKEVASGLECGIGSVDFSDWVVGDTIKAFSIVKKRRTLEEASASVAAALAGAGITL